jgi:predicted MFS family arabinose efflux permease
MNASRFLTVAITGTLLVFGIAALAGALLTGRR